MRPRKSGGNALALRSPQKKVYVKLGEEREEMRGTEPPQDYLF